MLDESKAYEIGNANIMKKWKRNNNQNQEEKLRKKRRKCVGKTRENFRQFSHTIKKKKCLKRALILRLLVYKKISTIMNSDLKQMLS